MPSSSLTTLNLIIYTFQWVLRFLRLTVNWVYSMKCWRRAMFWVLWGRLGFSFLMFAFAELWFKFASLRRGYHWVTRQQCQGWSHKVQRCSWSTCSKSGNVTIAILQSHNIFLNFVVAQRSISLFSSLFMIKRDIIAVRDLIKRGRFQVKYVLKIFQFVMWCKL